MKKQTAITISINNENHTKGQTLCVNDNGEQRMTSLEIAELTGKQHKNMMRDIRNRYDSRKRHTPSKCSSVYRRNL